MSIERTPEDVANFHADMSRINESTLVEEAGYILAGLTMKLATVEHLLALRNLTAEAYRLIDRAQNADPLDESDIRKWKRRAGAILDARVR